MRHFGADNPLFTLARSGRRTTHPLLAIAIALGALLFGSAAGEVLLSLIAVPADPAVRLLVLLVLGFAPTAALVWMWVRGFEGRGWSTLGFTRDRAGWKSLRGFLTGLLSFGLVTGLLVALGYAARENVPEAFVPALVVLAGWIVQSSTEEVLVRGFLMPVVGARWGAVAGVGVSALLFALLHGLNPGVTPLSVVNLVLVGVLLGLYALYEGALWGVCLWHAAWNWAQGSVFGFEVSGQTTGVLSVVDLREQGPDVVTGGAFGPEGGLASTLVLLLGVAVVVLVARRVGGVSPGRRRPASPPDRSA
ncbi:CPBP family intramembrane glutamic endopeptidase [Nonomuraea sp. NPDC050328]|uniref:CPBP family intramembrane glutamic endopeptidase n=1 Tax=Nonomuraea sp. NPDC050328 TaxID=3364361 RepID=UPI00378D694B